MQQHHQGFQDFNFFFKFNILCIISESFNITTSDQPTNTFSSSPIVFIEKMRRLNGIKYLLSSINAVHFLSAFEGLNREYFWYFPCINWFTLTIRLAGKNLLNSRLLAILAITSADSLQ